MILKEEDAKTKICPFSFASSFRQAEITGPKENIVFHDAGPVHCLGSACMAWHWRSDAPMATNTMLGWCELIEVRRW